MVKLYKVIAMFSILIAGLFSVSQSTKNVNAATPMTYTSLYDSNGDLSYTGDDLRYQLTQKIANSITKKWDYGNLNTVYKTTDVDLSNSGNVILYYTGESFSWNFSSFSGTVNREHVWPQSLFGKSKSSDSPYADIYQVRPCNSSLNNSRGNSPYDVLSSGTNDKYGNVWGGGSGLFYPSEAFRGDVARTIFYCATRFYKPGQSLNYNNLEVVDSTNPSTYQMGKLSSLLEWSILYSPSALEIQRNNEGEKLQGNRNPFIDHPEYIAYIWGDTNSTTKAIVAKYTYTVSFNSNGGSAVSDKNALLNTTISKPVNPTKSGATFEGWYTDTSLTKEFDFSSKITGNQTLYAKWSDSMEK